MDFLDFMLSVPSAPKVESVSAKIIEETEPPRDIERIKALPRRDKPSDFEPLIQKWTQRLGKGKVACECESRFKRRCADTLRGPQAWALEELSQKRGLLGGIGVGDGKSLLDLLACMVVARPDGLPVVGLLLIPPSLRAQMLNVDWHFYGQHWKLPNLGDGRWYDPKMPTLHVRSYSELSTEKSSGMLESLKPDIIILDEAHNVRNATAARTKRFRRYFATHRDTMLAAWSGTLTSRSIKDYAHLSNLALREGSPTPHSYPLLEEWAAAVDPSDFEEPSRSLQKLCRPDESQREGFKRRLHETHGVIITGQTQNCNASLIMQERPTRTPPAVAVAMDELLLTWQRPDGEELVDPMSVHRCAKELAAGFFYRWRWVRGETEQARRKWLDARKEWHKELRERLKLSRPNEDSPLLCAKAAIRWHKGYKHAIRNEKGEVKDHVEIPPRTRNGPLPAWDSETWPKWEEVRDTCQPETEGVWVDEWLAEDAADWARSNVGVVWYEHDVFGRRVAQLAGRPHFGPGAEASARIIAERGDRSVVASIRAHGTGKNLQAFCRNLVANPPSDAATWEQLIGRTHRPGQLSDEVSVWVYRHAAAFIEALERAENLAAYIKETMGSDQKLLRISKLW